MAATQFIIPYPIVAKPTNIGAPGSTIAFYAPGTTTLKAIYTDSSLTTLQANPLTADGAGRWADIYLDGTTTYKIVINDKNGAELFNQDPYTPGVVTGITGPAGDVAKAATRTALAAITGQAAGAVRYLTEAGRGGTFVWSSTSNAANVTADPNQGIYVAPATDTTGASGAWVRKFSGKVNVLWFGAVADWNGATGTDNGAAFLAALAYLNATAAAGLYAAGNLGLYIPKGKYWLNTTTLDIRTSITIEGDGCGEVGGLATFLKWSAGTTGIRVQSSNTTGATSSQALDTTKSGSASIISKLYLEGSYTSTETEAYGIQLRARASIRDCWVNLFEGDGIYIVATAGGAPEGNCNNFEINKCISTGNRNGLYTSGADVNAGMVTALDCFSNRAWGVNENGFLGNTYTACHMATNTSGPYRTTNASGRNVFIGCYSESDQPTSAFVTPTVIIGGLHAAGVSGTGSYVRATSSGLNARAVVAINDTGTRFVTIGDNGGGNQLLGILDNTFAPLGYALASGISAGSLAFAYANNTSNLLQPFLISTADTALTFGRATAQPHMMHGTNFMLGYTDWARNLQFRPNAGLMGPTEGGNGDWEANSSPANTADWLLKVKIGGAWGTQLSGVNTGDQTITLTGNVTGSGTGPFATTIAAGVVTLAMQANMATGSLVYRKTAGAGAPEVQTLATLKTDLGLTGTNSGDQTSIVGITGTIAQFNTAITDADIVPTGLVTASGLTMSTGKLLGRSTAATGAVEELATVPAANMPALTGDITTSAGAVATTLATNIVTYAKFQQVAAVSLVGNATGSLANATGITLAGGLAFSGSTLTAAGALTPTSVASTGAITSSSATAGVGYATGAGGAVTQLTSKSTAPPAINKMCGQITMNNAALAAGAKVSFAVSNTSCAATDIPQVAVVSGGTANAYRANVTAVGASSFTVTVENITAGSLSEAPVIGFFINKAVAA